MNLTDREQGEVVVLTLDGELDGHTAPAVQDRLGELLGGHSAVLLDLSETQYLSSAGLRILLLSHREAERTGGRLALCGVRDDVMEVMSATGFASFFTITGSVDEGLEVLST